MAKKSPEAQSNEFIQRKLATEAQFREAAYTKGRQLSKAPDIQGPREGGYNIGKVLAPFFFHLSPEDQQQLAIESMTPFYEAFREVRKLAIHFNKVFPQAFRMTDENLRRRLGDFFEKKLKDAGVAAADVTRLAVVFDNAVAKDLSYLIREVGRLASNDEKAFNEQSVIKFFGETPFLAPSEELFNILRMTRVLGLINYDLIHENKNKLVVIIGTSVGAALAKGLTALGFKRFIVIDADPSSVSNTTRLEGNMAKLRTVGMYKVDTLAADLYEVNPWSEVTSIPGKAILPGAVKGKHDIPIEELLRMSPDAIAEIVDWGVLKNNIRDYLLQMGFTGDLLFPADARDALIVVEGGKDSLNPLSRFGMQFDDQQAVDAFSSKLKSQSPVGQIHTILEGNIPADHELSLMMAGLGMIPFVAQDGTTSAQMRSLSARAYAEVLNGTTPRDAVIHMDGLQGTMGFGSCMDNDDKTAVHRAAHQIFMPPRA